MQHARYFEMLEDDQAEARACERLALERSIELMLHVQANATPSARAAAVSFAFKLWTLLLEDLAAPSNALPKDLRAQIISIGIWVLRELESIRNEPTKQFTDVIAVSKAIKDGLL
jgi:flagellar protein FlaF